MSALAHQAGAEIAALLGHADRGQTARQHYIGQVSSPDLAGSLGKRYPNNVSPAVDEAEEIRRFSLLGGDGDCGKRYPNNVPPEKNGLVNACNKKEKMEAPGVEPGSKNRSALTSTCLSHDLIYPIQRP